MHSLLLLTTPSLPVLSSMTVTMQCERLLSAFILVALHRSRYHL